MRDKQLKEVMKYLFLAIAILVSINANATTQTIHPTNIIPKVGTVTGSYTTVAAVDSYTATLVLDGSKAHTSWYTMVMPSIPAGEVVNQINLSIAYNGNPAASGQIWKAQLQNISTGIWDTIGTTAGATGVFYTITGTVTNAADYGLSTSAATKPLRVISTGPTTYASGAALDLVEFGVVSSTPPPSWPTFSRGANWEIRYAGTAIPASNTFDVINVDGEDTTTSQITAWKSNNPAIRVICYFSAGSWENWRSDQASFPAAVKGNNMAGWAGEKWLDTRDLTDLMPIMTARMTSFKNKGCDAVDPDNVDGYANSTGFPLTQADSEVYVIAISDAAHTLGLATSLKNFNAAATTLEPYVDFFVNEECYHYTECSDYNSVLSSTTKPILQIEYVGVDTTFCPIQNAAGFDTLKKHLALDTYRISCRFP